MPTVVSARSRLSNAAWAGVALLLTAVVAFGSRGHPGSGHLPASYSRFLLFGGVGVAVALGLLGLGVDGYASLAGARRRAKFLVVIIAVLLLTALVSSLFRPYVPEGSAYGCHPSTLCRGQGKLFRVGKAGHHGGGGGGLAGLLTEASLLAAFVAAGVGLLFAARREPVAIEDERPEPSDDELLPDPLAEAVEESLDDLRAERDVRRAVIACYARMETAMVRSRTARRPHEAPFEFLVRVLERVAREPGRTLTELFERAKFSVEPMGSVEKEQAIAALELLRTAAAASAAEVQPR
jgi:hypothetical protein